MGQRAGSLPTMSTSSKTVGSNNNSNALMYNSIESLRIDTNQGFDTNGKKNKIPKAPLSSKSISNSNRSSRDRSSNNAAAQATAQAASQAAADITAMSTLSPTKGGTNHRPKKK